MIIYRFIMQEDGTGVDPSGVICPSVTPDGNTHVCFPAFHPAVSQHTAAVRFTVRRTTTLTQETEGGRFLTKLFVYLVIANLLSVWSIKPRLCVCVVFTAPALCFPSRAHCFWGSIT